MLRLVVDEGIKNGFTLVVYLIATGLLASGGKNNKNV